MKVGGKKSELHFYQKTHSQIIYGTVKHANIFIVNFYAGKIREIVGTLLLCCSFYTLC